MLITKGVKVLVSNYNYSQIISKEVSQALASSSGEEDAEHSTGELEDVLQGSAVVFAVHT